MTPKCGDNTVEKPGYSVSGNQLLLLFPDGPQVKDELLTFTR